MAKKYLDLDGLKYTVKKIDNQKANVKSPSFIGTPTAPTPNSGNKNQLVTVEYVE